MVVSTKYIMEYNAEREHLILPEYGRNIQKMVAHAKTVEDREERNKVMGAIIKLMGMMNPHLRDVDDYNHKLWDHAFMLADFDIDVESPYPVPARESFTSKPNNVPYPKGKIRYGHFGKSVQHMIDTLEDEKDAEKQKGMAVETMNLMKRFYVVWNGETIADNTIFTQFKELCKKGFNMDYTDIVLAEVKAEKQPNTNTNPKRHKKGGKNGGPRNNKYVKKKRV
ncbi:MAG: hypothetical protein ACI81Y_002320 [Glaciecola sp.]|jgi:hypothetical protein